MGVLDTIEQTARVLGNATSIHQSASYLHNQIKNGVKNKPGNGTKLFTFKIPETATVGQVVKSYGTAPPGVVEIFSNAGLEKTVYPDGSGNYAANLFFSNPGTYLMYAVWNNVQTSNQYYVDVKPA